VRLTKSGRHFWLAGLGDQLAFQPTRRLYPGRRIGVDDLAGTLRKVPDGDPVILLAHEPDIMPRVPERVSLVLSGHTHGGQVRLFGWSPVVPSRYRQPLRLWPRARAMRFDRIGRPRLQHRAGPFGVPPEIVVVSITGA
jgi:predicted MPP superfamily phosphohydrolase